MSTGHTGRLVLDDGLCWVRRGDGQLYTAMPEECAHEIADLRTALVKAVEVIQTWHNMGVPLNQRSALWDLYWRNAPELKLIRDALSDDQRLGEKP